MTQTIKDLWNGNIAPCEHCGSHDPEINKLNSLMVRHRNSLHNALPAEQLEVFEKYADCSEEYTLLLIEQAFCDGFCIAAQLWTDALHSH